MPLSASHPPCVSPQPALAVSARNPALPLALAWWWGLLLIGSGLFLLVAFWPGQLSVDSLEQIRQGRTGEYTNWHPPVMAWLVGKMDQGRFGARLPTVLVITAYFLSWWRISWKISVRRGMLWKAGLIAVVVWPPAWALLGVLWKDVWMAVSLLLTVVVAWRISHHQRWAFGVMFVGCLMAASFRHNAVAATLPFLAIFGTSLWPGHRRWHVGLLIALVHVICLATTTRAVDSALHASRGWQVYPVQNIFLYDLTAISLGVGRNLLPVAPNDGVSLQVLREVYNTDSISPLLYYPRGVLSTRSWDDVEALAHAWLRAVVQHPWLYVQHRSAVFGRQMALTGPGVCYPYRSSSDSQQAELVYSPGWAGQLVWKFLAQVTFLFSGWMYVLLCLILCGVGCLMLCRSTGTASERDLVFLVAVSSSGAVYGLAYFFVSVSCDFRFSYWSVLAAGCSLAVLAAIAGQRN